MIVTPSILTCDFTKIEETINEFKKRNCKYLHLDVMDGNFVPRISFGAKYIHDLVQYKDELIFDTHIMAKDPLISIDEYLEDSDIITIHIESENVDQTIEKIINANKKVGISIKPNTDVEEIAHLLHKLDMVLVMSVEPGLGGQKFMPSCIDKIKKLKELREVNKYNYLINVDGGINDKTALLVKEAGVDLVVSGSYVVDNFDNLDLLHNL